MQLTSWLSPATDSSTAIQLFTKLQLQLPMQEPRVNIYIYTEIIVARSPESHCRLFSGGLPRVVQESVLWAGNRRHGTTPGGVNEFPWQSCIVFVFFRFKNTVLHSPPVLATDTASIHNASGRGRGLGGSTTGNRKPMTAIGAYSL